MRFIVHLTCKTLLFILIVFIFILDYSAISVFVRVSFVTM